MSRPVFYYLLIFSMMLVSCDTSVDKIKNPDGTITIRHYWPNHNIKSEITSKDSLRQGITRHYDIHGKLTSEINFKDNLEEGVATNYFPETGKKQEVIFYKEGLKEGEAKSYYENGRLFKTTQFVNGKKQGLMKVYYDNGKIQSECEYYKNNAGIGLKEYNSEGKMLSVPQIQIKEVNHLALDDMFILEISLSDNSSAVTFYQDTLLMGKYLYDYMREIPTKNGIGKLEFYMPYSGLHMEKLNIIAVKTTHRKNKMVFQRKYNLVIQR